MVELICKICGKNFVVTNYKKDKAKYCSHKCYGKSKKGQPSHCSRITFKKGHTPWNKGLKTGIIPKTAFKKGSKHCDWKGGRTINSKGYIFIYNPNHPFCKNNRIKRSRLVMEKHLGRYLTEKEIPHHKGIKYPISSIKNRQDDRIENLQLFPNRSEHMKFHRSLKNRHF